jgi:hypothetical protein
LLNSDEIHTLIRRSIRKLFGDIKINEQEISDIMVNDILKREIIESEESKKAKKDIEKAYKKPERAKEKNVSTSTAAKVNTEIAAAGANHSESGN